MEMQQILDHQVVIPVITIHDDRLALPLARALLAGGLSVLEITLRTKAALNAIKIVTEALPDAIIGGGTITNPKQFATVKRAGAKFAVSPCLSSSLVTAAKQVDLPYLPGVATASEIMTAKEMGFSHLKFFPAELMGGPKALSGYQAVFPEIQFCPTGGINRANMAEYLKLDNVIAVGGTWLAPQSLIEEKDWGAITSRAQALGFRI